MEIARSKNITEALLATPFLSSLDRYYPDISHWYVNTVVPGLVDESTILLLAKRDNCLVGMALGKKGDESKLRCVRVHPSLANTGLGIKLIDKMIVELENEKPHCTVSEELLGSYSRAFINRYGFRLDHVAKGQYRRGKLEYQFNKE